METNFTSDTQSAIRVTNLSKHFDDFVAADDINFEVSAGEIFGFLGPNGAGKSTTIKMLCGLIKPTTGYAFVGGYNVEQKPEKVKEIIGYMSQKFSLYEDLSVEENINFFGGVYGLRDQHLIERKKWILKMAELMGREKTLTRDLAGGWKQRLAIGCAILHKPKIVFLDEPTAGVDPISRRNFWDLIYSLAEDGITIFVTTHYLDEAEHCHRIGLIMNGKIKAIGSPTLLKNNLRAFEIYEVHCNQPIEAMELLTQQSWVKETSMFGMAIHISTSSGIERRQTIKQTLESSGIQINRIDLITPSLEDVFIHYTTESVGSG